MLLLFAPSVAAAQSYDIPVEINVTAARICEDNSGEIRWTRDSRIQRIEVAFSNSSDSWTSGWLNISAHPQMNDRDTFEVGRVFDKAAVNVRLHEQHGGTTLQFILDTNLCSDGAADPGPALQSITVAGRVVDDSGAPVAGAQIRVSNWAAGDWRTDTDSDGYYRIDTVRNTGFVIQVVGNHDSFEYGYEGFSQSYGVSDGDRDINVVLNRFAGGRFTGIFVDANDQPVVGAVLSCWNCGKGSGDPFPRSIPNPVTDATGRFTWNQSLRIGASPFYTGISVQNCQNSEYPQGEPYFWRFMEYGDFEITTPGLNDIGTIKLDCELPAAPETPTASVTPTPPVTPGETPTATSTPDVAIGENDLHVTLVLPNDEDISGAPYSLFAPQAAVQFQSAPYVTGNVGADNTIQIDGLVPGEYRLVVSPDGMHPIEAIITVGNQPVTEVVVTLLDDGNVTVEYAGQVATTAPSGDKAPEASDKDVTGLPSTGSGTNPDTTGIWLMLTAVSSVVAMIGHAVRNGRR